MTNTTNDERKQAPHHIRLVIVRRKTYIAVITTLMCGVSMFVWAFVAAIAHGFIINWYDIISIENVLGTIFAFVLGSAIGFILSPLMIFCLWRKNFDSCLWLVFGLSLATGIIVNLLVPERLGGPHNVYAGYLVMLLGALVISRLKPNIVPRARGHCLYCNYNLRGDYSGGCPECGWRREGAEKLSGDRS